MGTTRITRNVHLAWGVDNKMCTNLVLFRIIHIFAETKGILMIVVSSREFRANQRKYFDLARVNDVVITSRSHGSYRLVPISEEDTLIDKDTLDAKIRKGIADYEAGRIYRMQENESSEAFLERMINEG